MCDYFITDPILQDPTSSSVRIVWFTECVGEANYVEYGESFSKTAICKTIRLSRIREDSVDKLSWVFRSIYRHEAILENLQPNKKKFKR
jgi:hypothetical protein